MNTKKKTPVQQIIEKCNKLFNEHSDELSSIMREVILDYCFEQENLEKQLLIEAYAAGQNFETNEIKMTATKYLKQVFTDKIEDENTNAKFDLLHGSDTGRNKRSRKKKAA